MNDANRQTENADPNVKPGTKTATASEYLDWALAAHEAYYDIAPHREIGNRHFDAVAQYHSEMSQYVGSKRVKLWTANTHDHVLFKIYNSFGSGELADIARFVQTDGVAMVKPESNHMTTYITVIVITDRLDSEALCKIEKTKFRKNFKMGFKGWMDLRLAVVDLSCKRIVTNRQGSDLTELLSKYWR